MYKRPETEHWVKKDEEPFMEPTSRTGRYLTLRDYLRVLRRYALPIITITIVGGVAGFVAAKQQTPAYQATASVSVTDPEQNVTLAGLIPGLVQQPANVAAQNAETLTRPSVMLTVKRSLHTTESVATLSSSVAGQVTPGGLLQITATASNPAFASRLANAVASVLVAQNNQSAQSTYRSQANAVASEVARFSSGQTAFNAVQLQTLEQQQARLAALGRFARTSQVAQPASQPTSASSPNTARSTGIGVALGLLLALLMAFVRDTLDRRLRTREDVATSFHIPVLAHVRNQVMGKVAQIAAVTKDGHIDDVEVFRILRRNLEALSIDSPPRSILVTSAAAEEGKTTVASSLAFALASAGKRTLLVDCDLRQSTLAGRLGISPAPGMSEFLAGTASPQEIIHPIRFGGIPGPDSPSSSRGGFSLVAIPAGSPNSHSAELLGSSAFRDFLQQVLATYDVVVFDSSPLLPVADTLEMLPHVDAVIICARESKTTRGEAQAVKTTLDRFPSAAAGVVVTGVRPRHSEYAVYSHALVAAT
jgi:succinoglycan biosynthesis transport protein ExoP